MSKQNTVDKDLIIKACENWIKNHVGEPLLITYESVVQLLEVLKSENK